MRDDSNVAEATPSTEAQGRAPAPHRASRPLRLRSRMRVGLSTSLAAGALEGNKKPPVDEE
jgi:hypothetical protein